MTGIGEPLLRGAAGVSASAHAHLVALGRGIERADATARILEAHLLLAQEHPLPDMADAGVVLRACGVDRAADDGLSRRAAIDLLTADRAHPASIPHALVEARDAARLARDALPAELYDMLVATRARLPRKVVEPRVGDFLAWVRERSALAVGLVESAVARDGAFELIALGRRLERAAATARLLTAHADDAEAGPGWMFVLRSAGAHEAHVRAHRGAPTASAAIELLALDERFPRSVAHGLVHAEQSLRALGVEGGATGLAESRRAAATLSRLVEAAAAADADRVLPRRASALRSLHGAVEQATREILLVLD
ncbi:alpha-E domain-containing protein [Microcella alkalica]|uniref:Putative alpha-E superfamily protein n=1 Tax=Microcella alkalica TaxID=355930 RepID=A0A839E821_9MICO|nr:alpha-E domain-containing protein [Microcella alkalica]MBA8848671.1 putative alpha-E superfamily protein [Microcella alkalica]